MTTIAEKLDSILNTKDAIRHVIEDNDVSEDEPNDLVD